MLDILLKDGSVWLTKRAPGHAFITALNPKLGLSIIRMLMQLAPPHTKRPRATGQQLSLIHYTVKIRLDLQVITH